MQVLIKNPPNNLSLLEELGVKIEKNPLPQTANLYVLSLKKGEEEIQLVSSSRETTLNVDHNIESQELLAAVLVLVEKFGGTILLDESEEEVSPRKAWNLLVQDEKEDVRAFLEKYGVLPPDALKGIRKRLGKAFF